MGYPPTPTSVVVTTHFPDSTSVILGMALGMINERGTGGLIGRLVEQSGPSPRMLLVLELPLSEEEGDRLLGEFLPDQSESPE